MSNNCQIDSLSSSAAILIHVKKNRGENKVGLYNVIVAFNTETSSPLYLSFISSKKSAKLCSFTSDSIIGSKWSITSS